MEIVKDLTLTDFVNNNLATLKEWEKDHKFEWLKAHIENNFFEPFLKWRIIHIRDMGNYYVEIKNPFTRSVVYLSDPSNDIIDHNYNLCYARPFPNREEAIDYLVKYAIQLLDVI